MLFSRAIENASVPVKGSRGVDLQTGKAEGRSELTFYQSSQVEITSTLKELVQLTYRNHR